MKKKSFSLFITTIIGTSLILGCQEPSSQQVTPQNGQEVAMAAFVKQGVNQATTEEMENWVARYKKLSFDELELFNKILNTYVLEKTTKNFSNAQGRVSESQMSLLTAEVKKLEEFSKKVNQASMNTYHKPYNQLSEEELSLVLTKVHLPIDLLYWQTAEPIKAGKVAACSQDSHPFTASLVNGGTISHTGWSYKSDPKHPNDCDYQVRYPAYSVRFSPRNPISKAMCDSFNNRIAYTQRSQTTYLLFGNNRINLAGGMGTFDVDMQ
ncbi:hypothetical protein BWI96_10410 [Siphonobacter sp. SORGH_AS_0500]|uniref:hypothetical protein n=1 Tax=Siphonobacter sp. SORGH_AS_0500 TaxID=1864824 RepID=UPI000CAD0767|nr:hypothetical protein [Siphonobacter sp. SORGH_AS_0500]PKK36774.1 hypothetical protein BWI96_10410 [Siphonobacter sp. SORGH_AS_0500]